MAADPLSIAGLPIGGIYLSIQLLHSCLQAFETFKMAVNMPQECAALSLRLEIEHERLRNWSEVAGLLECEDEIKISGSIRANRLLLAAILSEIQALMVSFAETNGEYTELHANRGTSAYAEGEEYNERDHTIRAHLIADISSAGEHYSESAPKVKRGFLGGARTTFRDAKSVIRHPRRLKWVLVSADKYQTLLVRLRELVDYLHELIDDQQMRFIHKTTQNTYLEMLQLRSSVGELKELIEAVQPLHGSKDVSGKDQTEESQILELASFKATSFALNEKIAKGNFRVTEFQSSSFVFDAYDTLDGPRGASLGTGILEKRVWVEWKELKDASRMDLSGETDSLERIKELAALLSLDKPEEFRTAKCLGYIDSRQDTQAPAHFGIVFETPHHEGGRGNPVCLLRAIKQHDKPSLSERITLANKVSSCVFYVHSVNWLHKALRSQNIVCFPTPSGAMLETPYLTGFEYARPARIGEATEATPVSPAWEIYRHPNIQGADAEIRQYYRKTFDIYSLGIILLEIALWKSIDEIVGITDIENASPKMTFGVRETLLQGEVDVLKDLKACVGEKYTEAVRACLVGVDAFGIEARDQETSAQTGAKLQEKFRIEVLDKIASISV